MIAKKARWLCVVLLLAAAFCGKAGGADPPNAREETVALVRQAEAAVNAGRYEEALRLSRTVLEQCRALKEKSARDKSIEANANQVIGWAYAATDRIKEAEEQYTQAIALYREAGATLGEANALHALGQMHYQHGALRRSLPPLEQALALYHQIPDRKREAGALTLIGSVHLDLGQPQQALERFQAALPLYHALGDQGGEASAATNAGLACADMGEVQKALEYYEQALPMHRAVGNKEYEANTLNNMADTYLVTDDPIRALELFRQARTLYTQIGDKVGEANALANIGGVYFNLGDTDAALPCFENALPALRGGSEKLLIANTLSNLGAALLDKERIQAALARFEEAKQLYQEVENPEGIGRATMNIGIVYTRLQRFPEAERSLEEAQQFARRASSRDGEINALQGLGDVCFLTRRWEQAQKAYQEALTLSRAIRDKKNETVSLIGLANAAEAQGQMTTAADHLRAALALVEASRNRLGGATELKVSFLESYLGAYSHYVMLLLHQNRTADAFHWLQRAKARALLDLIGQDRSDFTQDMNPEEIAQERDLRVRLARSHRAYISEQTKSQPEVARLSGRERDLKQAEDACREFENALYARHPHLKTTRAIQSVTLAEAAASLPEDSALLEYFLTQTYDHNRPALQLYLFCVTKERGRAVLRSYPITTPVAKLTQQAETFRALCASPTPRPGYADYKAQGYRLYRALVAPAEKQLTGKKRLLVCPDGPLWSLPFAALWTKPGAGGAEGFLISRYAVAHAYSATAAVAAQRLQSRRRGSAAHSLLALADPDFGPSASSVIARRSASTSQADTFAGERTPQRGGLSPLPSARREAAALGHLFPKSTLRVGREVQEARIKAECGQYRYLHFATHGFFNAAAPMMSCIALAAPPPGSEEDGFLTAREILKLKLSAEMVTLSACDSARGEAKRGEGLIGLTWALFAAGAPTQVVCQWEVVDDSTAQWMTQFYTHLKAGKRKDTALQAAMLSLMRDGSHFHPFYWAAFQVVGDTSPTSAPSP